MMIHVTDILHCRRCPKYAWNIYHKKNTPQPFFHMPVPFSSLWKEYLHAEDAVCGQTNDTNEMTLDRMKDQSMILFARFSYKECRTQIPVLVKMEQGYKAIYPYLNSCPRETEALRMKLNALIAQKAGIQIVAHEVLYIRKDYVRQGALDLSLLFEQGHQFFNKRNHPSKDIQECIDALCVDLEQEIFYTKQFLSMRIMEMNRNKNCTAGRRCIYYEDCFDDSLLPDDSVLFLTTSQNKLDAYQNGVKRICDLDLGQLEGFRLQYSQYRASLNGSFVDHIALSHWMEQIQFPISYLDFEWDTFGIPPYDGMKPFDVLCFQYSLHIEDSDHNVEHKDFFGTKDCREAFICSLIDSLPESGTILVYNMEGAEKLRLMQLSEQFPAYKQALYEICERMVDLSKPFETGVVYDNRMRGHYSLKNVLPVFTDEVSYQQLAIHDGLDAVHAYRTFEQADEAQKKKIRQNIRNYCRMDTYAEYVVYHGLCSLNKEE